MIGKTIKRFRSYKKEIHQLVYISWLEAFTSVLIDMFIGVYLLLDGRSLQELALYYTVYFFAIFVSFVIFGFLWSRLQKSLHWAYVLGCLAYMTSFIFLNLIGHDLARLVVFGLLNGGGLGFFALAHHSYTIFHVEDEERDFYSSMLSLGGQVLTLISPLLAILSFVLSEKWLAGETFRLLFYILPLIYLFILPIVLNLKPLIPPKVSLGEVKEVLFRSDLGSLKFFAFLDGTAWPIQAMIMPIIALGSLKTATNIGIFETLLGGFALVVTLLLAHRRKRENRSYWLGIAVIGFGIAYCLLWFWPFGIWAYVLFALIIRFFSPIYQVSLHTLELASFDAFGGGNHDPYLGILVRDFILFVSRIFTMAVILLALFLIKNTVLFTQVLIPLQVVLLAGTSVMASQMMSTESNKQS